MKNTIIEISKKKAKSGRTPIKMILHKLYPDDTQYNKNGISWVKEYCEQNLDSIKGMPLVAQFLDDEHSIPFGDHGNMIVEENKVVFEDSLVVGSFEKGSIVEGIEVNGEIIDAVVGEGHVYSQRFPALVEYLQEEYSAGNPVEGSVEICADESKGNTKIIYDGGWKEKGRKPQVFEYSGHALVVGTTPADQSALMLELNSYKGKVGDSKEMKVVKKSQTIELNKLSYEDIAMIVTKAFHKAMGVKDYYSDSYIYRFFPETSEVVFKKWDTSEYYMTTYKIEGSKVIVGDIVQVEEDWKPVKESVVIEVNAKQIRDAIINQEGGRKNMDEKIVELSTQLAELTVKVSDLSTKGEEKDATIAELNTLLVAANKSIEELTAKRDELAVEVNGYKEEQAKVEAEKVKAEVNSYFETEIPKNKFEDAEVESLKEYVEKCDLAGLKNAEAQLIVKKFKSTVAGTTVVETNAKDVSNLFFATKEEKIDEVEAGKSLFIK